MDAGTPHAGGIPTTQQGRSDLLPVNSGIAWINAAMGGTPMVLFWDDTMRLTLPTILILISTTFANAQSTRPAIPNAALELRATQAFNNGDYAEALPMLRQLVADLKSDAAQADKVAMIQEQIHVCQKNTAKVVAKTPDPAARPVAAVKPVVASRTPHPAPKAGEVLETTIRDLGNFDYDTVAENAIPDDVKALSGTTVRVNGFMIPMDQAENVSKFALVPSLFNCCVGQGPQIQHTIYVTCPKGKTVNYYPDEITVEGKLTVGAVKDEGYIVGIFALETSSVKPAAK
jgi:hypothetical protein